MGHGAKAGSFLAAIKRTASTALRTASGALGVDAMPKHFKPGWKSEQEKESREAFKPKGSFKEKDLTEKDDSKETDPFAGLAPSETAEAKAMNSFANPTIGAERSSSSTSSARDPQLRLVCAMCGLGPNQVLWNRYVAGKPEDDSCRPCMTVKEIFFSIFSIIEFVRYSVSGGSSRF